MAKRACSRARCALEGWAAASGWFTLHHDRLSFSYECPQLRGRQALRLDVERAIDGLIDLVKAANGGPDG